MSGFAFALSFDGSLPPVSELQRTRVIAALQERSPGSVLEHARPGLWAASSGPFGDLLVSGSRLLLRDGSGWGADTPPWSLPYDSGSYAACAFDPTSGELHLVADRFGTRPLFHACQDGRILVASECRALQAMGLPLEVDPIGLREALVYRWVSGESGLLSPPLRVRAGMEVRLRPGRPSEERQYWQLRFEREAMTEGSLERYQEEVEAALRTCLRSLDRRGAPVGILLSGGVDSSLLAALVKQELGSCVAFAARIPDFDNPELERARLAATHLGIELREVEVDPTRFVQDAPYIVRRLEELPRHPNNLVLLQLLRAAGEEVAVLLQGDGADTLFGLGMVVRMRNYARKRRLVRWLPPTLARGLVLLLEATPLERAWSAATVVAWDETRYAMSRDVIEYRHAIRRLLGFSHLDKGVWHLEGWSREHDLDKIRPAMLVASGIQGSLVRHDRLSRPEGLEMQAPFLSPEVMAVAVRMPADLLYQERTKPVLRGLCDRYLPPDLSRLKKAGFEVPWGDWVLGPLRPMVQEAERALDAVSWLPKGFLHTALRTDDREGAWTGLALYLLLREFGLLNGLS
jgi:asparagine synthase (glutamine-hydrolysing)